MNKKFVFGTFWIIALLVLSQSGFSHAETGEESINAVYHIFTGHLRLAGNRNPRPYEVPISWNIRGPPGPKGDQGEKGEPGEKGEDCNPADFQEIIEEILEEKASGLYAEISNLQQEIIQLKERITSLENIINSLPEQEPETYSLLAYDFDEQAVEPSLVHQGIIASELMLFNNASSPSWAQGNPTSGYSLSLNNWLSQEQYLKLIIQPKENAIRIDELFIDLRRSGTGPENVIITINEEHSYSLEAQTSFQTATIDLSAELTEAFNEPVSIIISAENAQSNAGTLRIDNLIITGEVLS